MRIQTNPVNVPTRPARHSRSASFSQIIAIRRQTSPSSAGVCHAVAVRKGVDEGEATLSIDEYLLEAAADPVPGVYAIYDSKRSLQYVGAAEDVIAQLKEHKASVDEDLCSLVRVKLFANSSMATEENIVREAQHWIEEEGGVMPPGNAAEAHLWSPSSLSSTDEGDQAATDANAKVSPFSQATVHRQVGTTAATGAAGKKELTVAAVDKALDDIRGYLFADGGDITVVDVSEDGEVFVRFEGACSTCSSQETTMTMGVERALRGAFGEQLKAVTPVEEPPSAAAPGAPPVADEAAVEGLLALLRPAVENYGGSMSVAELGDGVCRIQYDGPDAIWTGVRMAISDKFGETITTIERVD
eukprot:jgi/Ulvmu1/1996/UM012_0158.1